MPALLDIPWFRPEPFVIPLPEIFPGVTGIPLQPFGLLVAIGVLFGWHMVDRRARATGIDVQVVNDLGGHVIIAGFVLGHMLDAVFYHPDRLAERPVYLFEIWNGLSSFGGFCGCAAGTILWKLRRKMSALVVGDCIAFGFPFGWMFGRMGCFVVHDHPGVVTHFFLAVRDYRLCPDCPPGPPRHDLGLYEVIWSAVTACIFLVLARAPRKRGFFVGLVPLLYAPVRFGLDFLRAGADDHGDVRYFGLTPGHYGSILLAIAGAAVLVWIHNRPELELGMAAFGAQRAAEEANGRAFAAEATARAIAAHTARGDDPHVGQPPPSDESAPETPAETAESSDDAPET